MVQCILCFAKLTKSKSIILSEKVSETLTLSEAIQQQLIWIPLPSEQTSLSTCTPCFKSFKTFYDFLAKIAQKHPQVKTEKPENLKTEVFLVSPIDIKTEPETLLATLSNYDEESDFEWAEMSREESPEPAQKNAPKTKSLQYLKPADRTPEVLASGKAQITINGTEFLVPKTQLQSNASDERIARFLTVACELCGSAQPTFLRLIKHFRREHSETKPFLRCCTKKFYRRARLLDHLDRHDASVSHNCPHCQRTYKTAKTLKIHIERLHLGAGAGEACICNVCGRSVKSAGALKRHVLTHEEDAERVFECFICHRGGYKNAQLLKNHLQAVHNSVKSAICEICSQSVRNLRAHMRQRHSTEAGEKAHCAVCRHWVMRSGLATHLKRHAEGGVLCKVCGKTLKSQGSLYSHMQHVHGDKKPHACTVCGKAFLKEMKLREHVAVKHTREYLFKCRVLSCGKEFRAEANWKMHEKRQHPEEYEAFFKPFYMRPPAAVEDRNACDDDEAF